MDQQRRARRSAPGALVVAALVGAAALVNLLTPVAASAGPAARRAAAPPPSHTALVIGDSVLAGTYGNISADLQGWKVTVDAMVDRSTEQGLAVVQRHGTRFQVVVVQLGTNDGGTPSVYQPRLQTLVDALATVPHVVLLTIRQARPYYAQTNQVMRQVAATHPNVRVADWNAAALPTDTGGDGLHLTPTGSVHMAHFVAVQIAAAGRPTPTTTTTTTSTTTSTTSTTTTLAPTTTPPTSAPLARPTAVHSSTTGTDPPNHVLPVALVVAAVIAIGAVVAGVVLVRRRPQQGAPDA
jgi:lysophospholipase L1-like esterase